jgi:hypothetical protein
MHISDKALQARARQISGTGSFFSPKIERL